MSQQRVCPQCRQGGAIRVPTQSPRELFAALILMAPFECRYCLHRFLGRRVSTPSSHPIERREHLRIPAKLCLSFSGGKVRGEGIVIDVSLGGCIIKSDAHVRVDDIFYLEIVIAENEPPVEVAGMVRSVSARGIAFKFLRKAQENKRLRTFINSRRDSTPAISATAVEPTIVG